MGAYTLTYIYHDCFLLEPDAETAVLFDYWKDPLADSTNKDFPPLLERLKSKKRVYIIVSHHHKDHFSRRIFLWAKELPDVRYIVSEDVFKAVKYMFTEGSTYAGYRPPRESLTVLKPGESFNDGCLLVKAYRSTDIGNSYAVETAELKVFHAGDLNAWLWIDESTPDEVEEARNNFTEIISEIKADYPAFDVAMFPVDSRIGREYWWGAKYFVNAVDVDLFVPMHFELTEVEGFELRHRLDAGAFELYARGSYGSYLFLQQTRSRYRSGNNK
ncbi:MAG: MBL fold metallo-hydrolase [Muribaculaceae bacterium]|nr:MBL fold metallo-hydrolase [Muribaculaceae bacterium]